MGIDQAIARARRRQRALFRDEGRLERPSKTKTRNEATGDETPDDPELIYEGPLQLRPSERVGRDLITGERRVRELVFEAKFPVDTAAREGDVLTMTASAYDAGLPGRTFRVADVPVDGRQIARKVVLEEVTG